MRFINSIQSEWIKTKRSAASWLCIIGGFFIPTIYTFALLYKGSTLDQNPIGAWQAHFMQLWQIMSAFLLPMGVVMASSLITQLEFKNNTWKQLMTTPQSLTEIYFSKFTVILLMTMKFFLFFNIGIILSGIIPSLIIDHQITQAPFPLVVFLKQNGLFFITVLPIIAIQYLLSLQFKNFMVPIGVGILFLVATLIGNQWEHIYISPYSFCFLKVFPLPLSFNIYTYALIEFVIIMIVSYYLFLKKKEKG
jgi:hypothetical protein